MAVNISGALASTIMPIVTMVVSIVLACIIGIGLWYYFFIYKKRKRWYVDIYGQTSDGRLHLEKRDVLEERRINWGLKTFYFLKDEKAECTPPPAECQENWKGKRYAEYFRINLSLIPLTKKLGSGKHNFSQSSDDIKKYETILKELRALTQVRGIATSYKNCVGVEQNFIYVPIKKLPHVNVAYHQIDYELDMNRINQISNADEMFRIKGQFWEKYGALITVLVLVICVIIVIIMTLNYSLDVIKQALSSTAPIANGLDSIAAKLAGTPQ